MTISANTVWEVRSAGSNNSGGGFVAGASGTDRSQADSAFASGTNLTVDGTTNTDVAPDGYSPVAADVGNLIQITAGAGFTTGFYQIASIQSGKWRLDRSPAATGTSGGTWALGGALATIAKAVSGSVGSNWIFVKGSFTTTATITLNTSGVVPGASTPPNRITGYTTTRGDGGKATVTLSTNTGLIGLDVTTDGWWVENIAVDCASLGTSKGIKYGGNYGFVHNCKVSNHTSRGIEMSAGSQSHITDCEVTGGGSAVDMNLLAYGAQTFIARNYVHDNANGNGIYTNQVGSLILWNLVAGCAGANGTGIYADNSDICVIGNTVYGCAQHGIRCTASAAVVGTMVRNNLLVSNGGYGLNWSNASGSPAHPIWDGNAFYNNTSGARNNMDSTAAPYSAAPYTRVLDVTLTADPFTNAAGGDFTLNNTAGGGAACRSAGTPGVMPGTGGTGYTDIGVLQAVAAAGGAVIVRRGGTVMKM